MDPLQRKNFDHRLNQWIAKQGFWFQMRHSFGGGSAARVLYQLARMLMRLVIFLVLVAVAGVIYLERRAGSKQFHAQIQDRASLALGAADLQMRGITRERGRLSISRMAAEGRDDSFFHTFEARNINFTMGMFDGVAKTWNPGTIAISKLDMELRAGANDAEVSKRIGDGIFAESNEFKATSFEIGDATLRWGYSAPTRGRIENSRLSMSRNGGIWRLVFTGGTFTQNWLEGLEIVNLTAVCSRDGFVIETGELKRGAATVDLAGIKLESGENPAVSGTAKVRHYPLDGALPDPLPEFIGGIISGDFRVSGSTNHSDGVEFEGAVILDEGDLVTLREKIHLLQALSVVDGMRNYRRVELRDGSFRIKTKAGGLVVSDIDLRMEDVFQIRGNLSVRLPDEGERAKAIELAGRMPGITGILSGDDSSPVDTSKADADITLRKAARAGEHKDENEAIFDRMMMNRELRRQQAAATARLSRMLRYEGNVVISLPGDAFSRAGRLKNLYPQDPATGRIPMKVPLNGFLYELTLDQSQELYLQGQR